MTDSDYIKKTLTLAVKGRGNVSPNPMVGAVIVKDGAIVGEGYHQRFGAAHAEINALRYAGEKAKGGTLYVNLEPCCHHGKTPPCTKAIIAAGIKRVVIGITDPNPLVNRCGIQALLNKGIEVVTGFEEERCKELNRAFLKYITVGLPYVTLKIAQSIDGRIATKTGDSRWITSEKTRVHAHRLRLEHDAVIVGIGTVISDNPHLTVRHVRGRNPLRIILDSQLRIPLDCHLLTDKYVDKTIIATVSDDLQKIDLIKSRGAKVWQFSKDQHGQIPILDLLKKIAAESMNSVLVEGGARIYTSFLTEKLANRIVFMIAPTILGTGVEAIGDLKIQKVMNGINLERLRVRKSGADVIVQGDIL